MKFKAAPNFGGMPRSIVTGRFSKTRYIVFTSWIRTGAFAQ
ncbi:MAG: hypothetical protein RLN69_02080 [Woeseiaceae bacterium]